MTSGYNRIDGLAADAPELAGFGAFPVGVRTLHMVHRRQIDLTDPALSRCDRELDVELWYPATPDTQAGSTYDTLLRDGVTALRLQGRACRGAKAATDRFPLVILSHGYPGNRMLLSHLGETLASRGYLVASIDHKDSTYADKAAFISTLVNRPLDCRFVADELHAESYAIIGYSMGGYGALVAGGAGISADALTMESYGAEVLAMHRVPRVDPRLKAIVPIGPWGRQRGVWDAAGLAGLQVPMLLIAGSADDVSGYGDGMQLIHQETIAVRRYLLTFDGAGHNAAAPIPVPQEAFQASAALAFLPAEHYADPVWDTTRMNGIAQHFATAFLGRYLKDDASMGAYLSPAFPGFCAGGAAGLILNVLGEEPLQGPL